MLSKTLPLLKDPKILTAFVTGLVAPSLLRFVSSSMVKVISRKKEESNIYVGIELGGTNYNISFGKPEFDNNGTIIDFKLFKQTSGRVTQPEETLKKIV